MWPILISVSVEKHCKPCEIIFVAENWAYKTQHQTTAHQESFQVCYLFTYWYLLANKTFLSNIDSSGTVVQ